MYTPAFDSGLNLNVPPESLNKNELKEAVNVEFSPSTGAMTVRGGLVWSGRFDSDIDYVVPVPGRRSFLVRPKGTLRLLYFRWNCVWTVSGNLSWTGDLSIAAWDDDFLIALGGKLQKFKDSDSFPSLETISNSPSVCRQVFVRNGRVAVVTDDDTLRFSGIGDCETWNNNPNDDSTAQFVEIGYKDGMNIDAVIPLSRDLIIFKLPQDEPDKGTIYRLTGDYPDWAVVETAHSTGTYSHRSIQALGNDVYYITPSGIASLSAVTNYGEIQTQWPDRKVSPALTRIMDNSAELWSVPAKQQIWILPYRSAKEVWVSLSSKLRMRFFF